MLRLLQSYLRLSLISTAAIGSCLIMTGCSRLFFHPDRAKYRDPSAFGLTFSEAEFDNLFGWIIEPVGDSCLGTVLFLHGNAGNVSTHLEPVVFFTSIGYRVISIDYSGYGGSSGHESLEQIHHDVAQMVRFLARKEPNLKKRVIFAQSLGASVALRVLTDRQFHGMVSALILDSPFADYRQIAREVIERPLFGLKNPVTWALSHLVDNSFSPIAALPSTGLPRVLIMHGGLDRIVGVHHSESLCGSIGTQCRLLSINEVGHIQALNVLRVREEIQSWLNPEQASSMSVIHERGTYR
jgi:pimeloyl-ACP methyl ester carboxylesterase